MHLCIGIFIWHLDANPEARWNSDIIYVTEDEGHNEQKQVPCASTGTVGLFMRSLRGDCGRQIAKHNLFKLPHGSIEL